MLQTSWIAAALFSLAVLLYRRGLRRAYKHGDARDDNELDAVIVAIEREP
jgi:hypothetical protein